MKLSYVLLGASALIATQAMAADSSDAAKPPKEKKVCRREAVTGSIIGTRSVCHTKAEWEAIDAANANNADGELSRGRQQGAIVGASRNQ